jgi:hypothetical protein
MIDHSKAPGVDTKLDWKPLPIPELRAPAGRFLPPNATCAADVPGMGSENSIAIDSAKGVMDL